MRATRVAGKQDASCGQTSLERDHVAVSPRAGSVSTIGPLLVIPILTFGTASLTIMQSKCQVPADFYRCSGVLLPRHRWCVLAMCIRWVSRGDICFKSAALGFINYPDFNFFIQMHRRIA